MRVVRNMRAVSMTPSDPHTDRLVLIEYVIELSPLPTK
jgi:hypothetical protein